VSNHLISTVYKRDLGSMARKAIMIMLADKASDDGLGIWASKQRMADEVGASKQTVITTLKGLIEDGLVREVGQRKCANGYTVEYAIDIAALEARPLVKWHADQSSSLTGQAALPVKDFDRTSQAALPDQSSCLTQTLLNPPEPSEVKSAEADHLTPEDILEGWNDLASKCGLPRAEKMTGGRLRQAKQRLREYPDPAAWKRALRHIADTPFLRGENERCWRADIDFFLQAKSFTKLTEGSYGQAN